MAKAEVAEYLGVRWWRKQQVGCCETQGEVKTTAEFGAGDWLALVRGRLYKSFHSARHQRLHSSFDYGQKAKDRRTETATTLSTCPTHSLASCHKCIPSMMKETITSYDLLCH